MHQHTIEASWGRITEWFPGFHSSSAGCTQISASGEWRLEVEIPKTRWNQQTKLVDIEACGPHYTAHLLQIQAGPEPTILVNMDRHVNKSPGDLQLTGNLPPPKTFSWECPSDNDDCLRFVVYMYQCYLGAKMTGVDQSFTVTLGKLFSEHAEEFELQIGAGFTWAILQTKWCKAAPTCSWNWPFQPMRLPRATFRLDAVEGSRAIRLTEEDGETALLTFLPRSFTIMDIKKFIMTLREDLHGRPLAVIREEGHLDNVQGIQYDVPILGSEWNRPIDLAPRLGGTGMNLRYILLLFEEAGPLSPYICRDCHQVVLLPGGTCSACSNLLNRMDIQVF